MPDALGAVGEVVDDEDEAGALLEPLAALPLGWAGALEDELLEPPDAGALGVALEDELELLLSLSLLLMSTDAEPEVELEPDGAVAGVEVEPADDEDEGGVVRETLRSPSRSQPVSKLAPSARDTATARLESFIMGPPWLGYHPLQQGSGHL